MKTIDEQIEDLTNLVRVADFNFRLWWTYRNDTDFQKYRDAMNGYPLLFKVTWSAHFATMILALYALYETRDDSVNFGQVIQSFPPDVREKLEATEQAPRGLWKKKITILRNEVIAHLSKDVDRDENFRKAGVTPNELKRLVELSKELVNAIVYAHRRGTHVFNLDPSKEAYRLLDCLEAARTGRKS